MLEFKKKNDSADVFRTLAEIFLLVGKHVEISPSDMI